LNRLFIDYTLVSGAKQRHVNKTSEVCLPPIAY
jgi:hypothetical protein